MKLEEAVKIANDAKDKLRSRDGVNNPDVMSREMSRLAQANAAIEEHLAGYEKDFERDEADRTYHYLITQGKKVTEAERLVTIDLASSKGEIKFLSRIVASNWRLVGTIQSRHNHLTKHTAGQI